MTERRTERRTKRRAERATERGVRRIVIACDAVGEHRAAILAAVRLAQRWGAALHGVYVEDPGLMRLAELPVVRHVAMGPARSRPFDPETLEGFFAVQAERARAVLEKAAREHGLAWSFAVVRDDPTAAALAAEGDDWVVVEAHSRPFAGQLRLETRWSGALFATPHTVMLVRDGRRRRGGVVVLVQGEDERARDVIALAARMADGAHRALTLLLVAGGPTAEEARAWVRDESITAFEHCRVVAVAGGKAEIARAIAGHGGDLLVLDADPAGNAAEALRELVAATDADVLLVR